MPEGRWWYDHSFREGTLLIPSHPTRVPSYPSRGGFASFITLGAKGFLLPLTVASYESHTVVSFFGDINSKCETRIREIVVPAIRDSPRVILDFERVTEMTSAGIRIILVVYRSAKHSNSKVVLVHIPEPVKETLHMTGFLEFFITAETTGEAFGLLGIPPYRNKEIS